LINRALSDRLLPEFLNEARQTMDNFVVWQWMDLLIQSRPKSQPVFGDDVALD